MAQLAKPGRVSRSAKEAIINAAVQNFRAVGYHGSSLRDIARDAGVTVAAIYHHFESKQAILVEIMTRVMVDALSRTRTSLMSTGQSASEQLSALVHAWVLFHTERSSEAVVSTSELRSLDQHGYRTIVLLRDEQERVFHDVIEQGAASGEFSTRYPLEATRAIINMGYSVSSWYRRSGGLSPEEMAGRYVDLALGVVRCHPPDGRR